MYTTDLGNLHGNATSDHSSQEGSTDVGSLAALVTHTLPPGGAIDHYISGVCGITNKMSVNKITSDCHQFFFISPIYYFQLQAKTECKKIKSIEKLTSSSSSFLTFMWGRCVL